MNTKFPIIALSGLLVLSAVANGLLYIANENAEKYIKISARKVNNLLTEAELKDAKITELRDQNLKLSESIASKEKTIDACQKYIAALEPFYEQYKEMASKSKAIADAEADKKERLAKIRNQNIVAQQQRREDALQFEAQQRSAAADAAASKSRAAQIAQEAAESYFRSDYRPGGNSSVLVIDVSATVSSVEEMQGWTGRWRVKGRAAIGYYVSSGGSFKRESHDFEVEVGDGAPKVEVRS